MLNPIDNISGQNPLLDIETSFAAYLTSRTRTFKEHVVGGKLDYAFDADFALRQKINGMSGWSRIYRTIIGTEMPGRFKRIFQSASVASALLFPDAYDLSKSCAARLKMKIPAVYIRTSSSMDIYSMSSVDGGDFIVLTTGLYEACEKDELCFMIARECGRIQNNHCAYVLSAPFFEKEDEIFSEHTGEPLIAAPRREAVGKALEAAMTTWFNFAAITSDRAGIICLDNPHDFPAVFDSLYQKGFLVRRGPDESLDMENLKKVYETIRRTPARNISLDQTYNETDRRIFAALEFLKCETLYSWRPDLDRSDVHVMNKQALEVRCEIIITGGVKGGGL